MFLLIQIYVPINSFCYQNFSSLSFLRSKCYWIKSSTKSIMVSPFISTYTWTAIKNSFINSKICFCKLLIPYNSISFEHYWIQNSHSKYRIFLGFYRSIRQVEVFLSDLPLLWPTFDQNSHSRFNICSCNYQ